MFIIASNARKSASPRVELRSRRSVRRGQALAEFALISVLLYLLVGGALTLGYALFVAQGLQQAADLAAREISRTPLPPQITLDGTDGVLYGNAQAADPQPGVAEVRARVFDQHYLVLNVQPGHPGYLHGRASLQELIADLPAVNQQFFPLMISDVIDDGGSGVRVIRYPGRLYEDPDNSDDPQAPMPESSGYLVDIPLTGGGTVPVVEEIESTTNPDPFQLSSNYKGMTALRINYPFHSPFMFGVDTNNQAVVATDDTGLSLGPLQSGFGPYTGSDGMGKQVAMGTTVRPFRKVISGQALSRREIFAASAP
jgi:hypothetical protein